MKIKPAEINQEGIEMLLKAGERPGKLRLVDNVVDESEGPDYSWQQTYFPGISIPSIPQLREPFMVPVIGDNESVSLTINWPRRANSDIIKVVEFVGQLPAENITRIPDSDDPSADFNEREDQEEEIVKLFDDYTGYYGALLCARAIEYGIVEPPLNRGEADFVIMETEEEFDRISDLLDQGETSVADIARVARLILRHTGITIPNMLP